MKQFWPEGGRQFRGKYEQINDTIFFDTKIIVKTNSNISNKYLIDNKKHILYYIDSKLNLIDSSSFFIIDTIINRH